MKFLLPNNLESLIKTLNKHGYEAFAVGGCVRDTLMNNIPKDWDVTTNATPHQVKKIFRRTVDTGIAHGTVSILIGDDTFEVTTYRIDGEYEDNRHPTSVEFTRNLRDDLLRRDFTINAMAYSEETGIIDYFDGIKDIKNHTIKCVGSAFRRFDEDALRILRAIRFSSQLGFNIEENTLKAMKDLVYKLEYISVERIREEILKALNSNNPSKLIIINEIGASKYIFSRDIFINTEVFKLIMQTNNLNIRLAIFLMYFKLEPKNELKKLKFDNKTIKLVCNLIDFIDYKLDSDYNIKKLMCKIGYQTTISVVIMQKILSVNLSEKIIDRIKFIHSNECYLIKDLAIKGGDLLALGYKGEEIGKTLDYLLNMVQKNNTLNTYEILKKELQ